jgi:hypothetical protein
MRKRDQTATGAPSARCAQRLSSFRVACVALTMLAANRYVTWNGTFELYMAALPLSIARGNVGRHRSNRISVPSAQACIRPLQVDLAEHRVRRKQVVGGLINEYCIAAGQRCPAKKNGSSQPRLRSRASQGCVGATSAPYTT